LVMKGLVEDLVGKGESAAQKWLIPRASEPPHFRVIGRDTICGRLVRRSEIDFGPSQPWPASVGRDRGWPLAQERQPDEGDRANHGHAHLPRVQHDEGGSKSAGHDGRHARCFLGWGSVHRVGGQDFDSHRRRCGMTRLVK
jgi:hypothetical protein